MKKSFVVGVCGGVAAYKSFDVVSALVKMDFDVHVILTEHAKEFVNEASFRSLTGNLVLDNLFLRDNKNANPHIEMARSDYFLILPATANFLGKLANGIVDDALTSSVIATDSPVLIAPAMNTKMYMHPATQKNLQQLREWGYHFVDPAEGILACGDRGTGKLASYDTIMDHVDWLIHRSDQYRGKKVLITLGPTRNYLDPVRYITNPSSGKMGMAFARAFRNAGAEVTVISGKENIKEIAGVTYHYVVSSDDMLEKVKEEVKDSHIFVSAAAVGDYKAERIASQKLKKTGDELRLNLVPTVDILQHVSENYDVVTVGFAAETENLLENGRRKLGKKKLDYIIVNDVSRKDIGFEADQNEVILMWKDEYTTFAKEDKNTLAQNLVRVIGV